MFVCNLPAGLIERSSQPTHTEEFWAPDSQPRRGCVSTAQPDFTATKKTKNQTKNKNKKTLALNLRGGKSCYLQGSKAAAAAGREAGARRWAIKHLVSCTEENMLIKPHVNSSSK